MSYALIASHLAAFIGGAVVYAFYARRLRIWSEEEIANLKRKAIDFINQ